MRKVGEKGEQKVQCKDLLVGLEQTPIQPHLHSHPGLWDLCQGSAFHFPKITYPLSPVGLCGHSRDRGLNPELPWELVQASLIL